MRPAPALLLYLCLIFASAAFLAPWVYLLLHPFLPWPFHRYVDRLLMISALGWLLYFWPKFGLTSARDVDWAWPDSVRGMVRAFGAGLFLAGLIFGVMLLLHLRVWSGPAHWAFLPGMCLGLIAVSLLEGWLFHGVAQTIFVRAWGRTLGVLLLAALFASMHFIKVPPGYQPDPVGPWSGWSAICGSFSALGSWSMLGGYGLVLVLLSLIFSLCRLLFRDLGVAIGVHAGIIIGHGLIEHGSQATSDHGLWHQAFSANPLTQLSLALVLVALLIAYRRRPLEKA